MFNKIIKNTREEEIKLVILQIVIVVISFVLTIMIISFVNNLLNETESKKDKRPHKVKQIESYGVDGWCRSETSKFAKDSFNNQWGGGDPQKGDFSEVIEKVYQDCLQANK